MPIILLGIASLEPCTWYRAVPFLVVFISRSFASLLLHYFSLSFRFFFISFLLSNFVSSYSVGSHLKRPREQ
jgi:hypothetical protein